MNVFLILNIVAVLAMLYVILRHKGVPYGMAYSIFEYTSYGKVDLLSERMRRQQFWGNKFAQFVAPNFVKSMEPNAEANNMTFTDAPQFTGAPIEVFQEFIKMGQTDMRIPVDQRLVEDPVHGDAPLEGTEERATITWRTVKINRTRKAYAPPTGMSLQIIKKYADSLVTQAERKLTQWWNDYHAGNFQLATFAGASRDLLVPSAQGGRAVSYMSHPNLLVAGDGFVSYAGGRPGTAGYEVAVEAALNGLTNTASDYFSVGLVKNLVIEAPRKKIRPIVLKGGFYFYPLFISDAQWAQLQNDAEFKDFYKRLPAELTKHPLATMAEAYIAGAMIIPDVKLFGARINSTDANVTAGTVEYGPAPTAAQRAKGIKVGNWITQLDTSNIKLAVLLGASALSVGIGEKMRLVEDEKDYGNVKGMGVDTIQSVVRNDIFDQDGQTSGLTAGDFHENTSGIVVATYSKHTLTY